MVCDHGEESVYLPGGGPRHGRTSAPHPVGIARPAGNGRRGGGRARVAGRRGRRG